MRALFWTVVTVVASVVALHLGVFVMEWVARLVVRF